MLASEQPDRIHVAFDDHRLVANVGCSLRSPSPSTWDWVNSSTTTLTSEMRPGGRTRAKNADPGGIRLAGGDCIDDADVLRTGRTAGALGCVVKAPSTLGTFLRSFRWGHVRQLDRVSRKLLARAWAAGAGPGDAPFTIDLDSTICETYGLAKEGARDHGYTGQRGYHPLLAVAAGTGDVLMARLRKGRANTARGAAHFLRETVGRVRHGGARGQLTVRADSGFYTHDRVRLPQDEADASPSPSACTRACAISSRPYPRRTGRPSLTGWKAPPVAEATPPSTVSPTPRRCGSSRRVKPTPVALFANYRLSSPIGMERPWNWRPTIAATPRSRMPSETSSTAWGSTISPRAASPPTAPG